MKRIICLLLAILVFCFATIISTGAIPAPYFYGDTNTDNTIDVLDATFVQEYISKRNTMSLLQEMLSDVDADSKITIFDATMIQQRIAKTINIFPAGIGIYTYILLGELESSRESGDVGVDIPVTFTANPDGKFEPFTYDFYINGELIVEDSENNSFTYTFAKKGPYTIKVVVTNTLGVTAQSQTIFYVE